MKYLKRLVEAKKKRGRCWSGYKPAPGSTPYSKGSCVREAYKRLGFVIAEQVYRRDMNLKKRSEHAVKAKKKLDKSRDDLKTAKPGSEEQANALTRSSRAVAVYTGRLQQSDPNGEKK